MILDKEGTFSTEQAVTATARSTDCIDLGAARDVGASEGVHIVLTVTEAFLAAGAATLQIDLEVADNTAFTGAEKMASIGPIAKADLVIGKQIFVPVPAGFMKRYMGLNYTVASLPFTAGKISASTVDKVQVSRAYPNAI